VKGWEIVVGIETHTQLLTESKIFSGASTDFGAPPNTQASAVDLALPGTLPVLNRAAVECAIRLGLAVKGTINRRSIFARKNYFYPDLPKGYQISQYETPIVQGGELRIGEKVVRLTRAHLEEDAGKSLHEAFRGMSGIDLNRAGTPLLEIVSEPDLRGAQEAVARVLAHYAPLSPVLDHTDGVSADFGNWRFNLRSSNTEPLLRLNVEARGDAALLQSRTDEISQLLQS
jgi:aspartyl-tRNA(Asn)/glutamyl-tRNA(Gln) amidotransferase subunit B